MVYLSVNELSSGMCVDRDINFYDASVRTAICIRHGQKLTDVSITKMKENGIKGAYIDDTHSEFHVLSSVSTEIKNDAINNLQSLADNFIDSSKGVSQSDIAEVGGTTSKLIDALADKKDIMVNIADIKMYDDYTFHHCLSVAILAITIGMELGMSKNELYELGLAGLLHDIGKVSIPIEIINKNGRLTDEEYAIVKMHPIHAATHLKERKLVPQNCYLGIIAHHERWDGSGYPFKLAGEAIPFFARILAVADVYDALTSNRPYRIPSPPSEAIEFIMGGMGSHFDETVVRAFLRKIAPYPIGSKITLSNGDTATVVKNAADHPLRPLIRFDSTGRSVDMNEDMSSYNLVITGLVDPNLTTADIVKK
ncbi:MAG: HD-GYP domain-containing protein [Oscillospiraceae bacterium]